MSDEKKTARIEIKLPDRLAGGAYANNMVVAHTREEFVLDFMTLYNPRAGVVTARVIVSPGHLKRIVRALSDNLSLYEASYGELSEAPPPGDDAVN
ncbi:MAG: DUF3467 domain-containing protein [Acidobacteriota bacterium]